MNRERSLGAGSRARAGSGVHLPIALTLLGGLIGVGACRGSTDPAENPQWMTLAASEPYTCGLTVTGEASCWGWVAGYYDPQPIKDSLIPRSAVPLRVPGEHRFTDISVGALSICALDTDRRAFCWGANQLGEVGDDSYIAKRSPSAVAGNLRWRMISAGGAHTCGVTIENQAYCWGNQFRGALGNGELFGATPHPVAVLGNLAFSSVGAGAGTSCGVTSEGDAYCWGINDYGILGDGQPPEAGPETATPSRVVGGLRFTTLAVGYYNVCGITENARAYCWGYGGVLGNGSTAASSSPVPVSGELRWQSLSAGAGHTCGLTTEGAAYCWGSNEHGELGTGDTAGALVPRLVAPPGTYVAIAAGGNHTCARTAAGTAFCWGQGNYGQLGDGMFEDRSRPVQVAH